jgi:hypothetical protein
VYRFGVQGKKKIDAVKNKVKMIEIFKFGTPSQKKSPTKSATKKAPLRGLF